MNIKAALLVIALVLYGLAFFGVGSKYNLVAGGLFCTTLTLVI